MNSSVLLVGCSHGLEIGHQCRSFLYHELTGVLSNLLSAVHLYHTGWLKLSPKNKHLPILYHLCLCYGGQNCQDLSAAGCKQQKAQEE